MKPGQCKIIDRENMSRDLAMVLVKQDPEHFLPLLPDHLRNDIEIFKLATQSFCENWYRNRTPKEVKALNTAIVNVCNPPFEWPT